MKYAGMLFLIIVLGFGLRIAGIGYGLPDLSHPDESRVILDTLSMGNRGSLLPARPDYSLLYRYLLLTLYGIYFLIGKTFGMFKNTADFALQFMIDPSRIYLITRLVSAVFGTATGILAFKFARRFFDTTTAVVSLLFVLFEFQLLQHAQWAIYPCAFCFTTLLALYYIFLAAQQPSDRNFLLMGAATGIAISTQNHGIFLLPSVLYVVCLHFIHMRKDQQRTQFMKYIVVLLIGLGICSLIGNFYWLFIFKKAAAKYAELLGVTRVGFSSQAPYPNTLFSMTAWYLKELIRQDLILGAVMVTGILYAVYKRSRFDIIFLIYILINLIVFSQWGFRSLHDMLGVMPIVCVFAARHFVVLCKKMKWRETVISSAAIIIILPLVWDALTINIKKCNPDTRQQAKLWIEQNISADNKIALDWHLFNVPIQGAMPLYFSNPVASKYYNENISPDIKQRYARYLGTKIVYDTVEAMRPLPEPLWPADMPAPAQEEAAKHAVYQDLYSKFHFTSLDTLKHERVGYLIISSYTYGYFLFNDDQNKKNVFNPFVKDRPWLNYSQADHYIPDHRYGLLYFISRDAREFYTPLLNGASKRSVLVKEFHPDRWHFGPVIKIYRLI